MVHKQWQSTRRQKFASPTLLSSPYFKLLVQAISTRKALFPPDKFGKWEIGAIPVPKPASDEVVLKIQRESIFVQTYPFVSGTDATGIVEEVVSDLITLIKDDKMFIASVSLALFTAVTGMYNHDLQAASVGFLHGTVRKVSILKLIACSQETA
ncbi:uncharacterized protein BXZ73DRAFT_98923 [Epithele typhae]|uniref:uncharacterized protein n=1 Tax=Epithele typhae TaxID=378194 RepID=UPI002008B5DB|nr:uncharacterized protein BXZ73DRAFT_98923 [Epithele typhae]KAH9940495.1 hypothetical protein BXZ73DRAFT_98923 [Epithele typhae]